ncbi:MAG: transcription elongation factor GreA, partial [Proteobacteria bacterium]|nr:transcription elongation factor GreA [Pseudomonadota bacterium]
ENSERIHEAAAMGDLSENAEYKAAKEKQRMLVNSIRILKDEINKTVVRELGDIKGDFVTFGTKVMLKDKHGENVTYKILGPWETDIKNKIISCNSGIGQALEGKKVGERITFKNDEYTILSVKKLENFQ